MKADVGYIVGVLSQLAKGEAPTLDQRLANGIAIRRGLYEAHARGEAPEHYRIAWVQQSAKQLLELLEIMAQDFNNAHPDDLCSMADLLDLLGAATRVIEKHVADSTKEG